MSTPFPNLYTHRKVADASARGCDICYKQSTSVLITPDKKDFFYVCPIHLKDRFFCTPKIDEAAVAAKKREKELNAEKERVKKEYEEKQRKKKEKEEEKEKEKDKDKEKDKKKEKEDDKSKAEKDGKDTDEKKEEEAEEESRVFELKPTFYSARIQKKKQAEAMKLQLERASKPDYFPSVPSEPPSKK